MGDFKLFKAEVARQISGTNADGQRIELGPDVLLHWRLGGIEQGALNRIAMSDDTLYDEIERTEGLIAIGNPEDLREYLHDAIDDLFTAIYVSRGIISKEDGHNIRQRHTTLDDIVYKEPAQHEEPTEAE